MNSDNIVTVFHQDSLSPNSLCQSVSPPSQIPLTTQTPPCINLHLLMNEVHELRSNVTFYLPVVGSGPCCLLGVLLNRDSLETCRRGGKLFIFSMLACGLNLTFKEDRML